MLRFDRAEIKSKHLTDEGFLKVRGTVTRTGVFKYRNADGSVRRELRHPDDVLKADSLETMKNIPITLLHPKDKVVDAKNARKLTTGFTGEDVQHDGRLIDINVLVTDEKAINAIQNGTQELSLGYTVVHVDEQDTFQGEAYDVRQTEIKYNHLAIVPAARAGSEAKLALDAANLILDADDAVHFIEDDNQPQPKPKELDMNLVKMTLDNGIQYDAAPEVKVAHDALVITANDSGVKLEAQTKEFDALQAKHDALDEKVKAFEKNDNSEEIKKLVDARIALVTAANTHLDEKEIKDIETKSDAEIKELVIKKYSPDVSLDEKSEEYINARFDTALENTPKKKNDGKTKTIGDQRKKINNNDDDDNSENEVNADSSRQKMVDSLENQWKPAQKAA